jgi:hypothetical protein
VGPASGAQWASAGGRGFSTTKSSGNGQGLLDVGDREAALKVSTLRIVTCSGVRCLEVVVSSQGWGSLLGALVRLPEHSKDNNSVRFQ